MRLIPGKTKVGLELFKGLSLKDLGIYVVSAALVIIALVSNLPKRMYIAIVILLLAVFLNIRLDADPAYAYLMNALKHLFRRRRFQRAELLPVSDAAAGESAEVTEEAPTEKEPAPKLSKAQQKALEKEKKEQELARKKEKEEEDKLLKSLDTPEEVRASIQEKRSIRYAEAAAKIAAAKEAATKREPMQEIIAFTDIKNDMILYGKSYYGAVLEIPPVEFRFFSQHRRDNAIENGLGRVLRSVRSDYGVNIVKLDRPMNYESYLDNEYKKLDELRASYESGFFSEDELKTRVEIMYDRIYELQGLCSNQKVVSSFYYIVLFDSDVQQLNMHMASALETLRGGELNPKRLNTKELAVFLKYSNEIDFDEHEIDKISPEKYAEWARPRIVDVFSRTVHVNRIITHNAVVSSYPSQVGDAWLASVMSLPGTKVVLKCAPMDSTKSIKSIDQSLQELRSRQMETGIDSRRIELQTHIDTLTSLLLMLQGDNEILMNCNVYVTAYDIARTRKDSTIVQPPESLRTIVNDMKRMVRRTYSENNMKLNFMDFNQHKAFVGSQISGYDPFRSIGRGMPTNTIAAVFPWIYAYVSDKNGVKLGASEGVPVFIDFFRRDSERVNSNMVIVGKSGSGKSYATKSLLSNLAADDAKIFILDPENEYSELAQNLHGKFINVANAQYGRLNPFHIITALDDDESDGEKKDSSSYGTHLQFLEEFFRQILPDCEKDALEYLNTLIDRMYINKGISEETDLSRLRPEDYPIFDDLYDTILNEFQRTDNEYIRSMLRTLINYVSKFSAGGRNSGMWDGPSTVTTEENFTVFNFQSLLSNRNGTIANAQMLLVLKYIDNEIIKNRDYNTKYGLHRKVVVVIDEAHVFIDTKYPIALDFMFQLAKRIRKYNGMQIVITQNIKDFVGSEEIARKSTAIINACQYSFIFALAPNDMDDLCKLYEKAGGINENEQEQIVTAPRGHAFTVMGAQSRSSFTVEVPEGIVELFQEKRYTSKYFAGMLGEQNWTDFIGESREKREKNHPAQAAVHAAGAENVSNVIFEEISEDSVKNLPADFFDEELPLPEEKEETPSDPVNSRSRVQFETVAEESYDVERWSKPAEAERPVEPKPAAVQQVGENVSELVSEMHKMVETLTKLSYEGMEERMKSMLEKMLPTVKTTEPYPGGSSVVEELQRVTESLNRLSSENGRLVSSTPENIDTAPIQSPTYKEPYTPVEEAYSADEGTMRETGALGSIFNAEALEEARRLQDAERRNDTGLSSPAEPDDGAWDAADSAWNEAEQTGQKETEGMQKSADFEILLDKILETVEDSELSSAIEMMEIYGEQKMEVTLVDLAKYISHQGKATS